MDVFSQAFGKEISKKCGPFGFSRPTVQGVHGFCNVTGLLHSRPHRPSPHFLPAPIARLRAVGLFAILRYCNSRLGAFLIATFLTIAKTLDLLRSRACRAPNLAQAFAYPS